MAASVSRLKVVIGSWQRKWIEGHIRESEKKSDMGISSDEMKTLMNSRDEAEWEGIEVRKVKPRTGERRGEERRRQDGASRNFLGMDRRVQPDRRTSRGKSRIQHNLEFKGL